MLSWSPFRGLEHPQAARRIVIKKAGKNDQTTTMSASRQESTGDLTLNSVRKVDLISSLTEVSFMTRSLVLNGKLSKRLAA